MADDSGMIMQTRELIDREIAFTQEQIKLVDKVIRALSNQSENLERHIDVLRKKSNDLGEVQP